MNRYTDRAHKQQNEHIIVARLIVYHEHLGSQDGDSCEMGLHPGSLSVAPGADQQGKRIEVAKKGTRCSRFYERKRDNMKQTPLASERLLAGLNPMQRRAVETTEGPVQVVAGAGSGKTRVLTHRVAYLLFEKRIRPWHILAITFTNKAASEMKERIVKLVGPEANEIWISTFHAMCVRILRREIEQIGYSRNFTILDTSDQLTTIKQVLKEENVDAKKFEPRAILRKISAAKNEMQDASELKVKAASELDKVVARVYEKYQQKLALHSSLDFDDLLLKTVHLFAQVPEVKEVYQRKFQYIHVDEYQDTNHVQYILVKQLAAFHQNVCVVGDGDQSIYRFRGADVHNIFRFERDYPQVTIIKLEQNYRSTKKILAAANHLIAHNTERKPKDLWTDNEEGKSIQLFEADTEQAEAYYVVETIRKGREQGDTCRDYAVLYRTNAQSRVIEEVLLQAHLPYQVLGGIKFYERKEIKDVLAYLRLMANLHDDLSLQRIINVPRRGVGAATMDRLTHYANTQQISLFQALLEVEAIGLTPRMIRPLQQFVELMRQLHAMAAYLSAVELTEEVLVRSGYREELQRENTLEAASRLENIDELLSAAQAFEKRSEDKSLVAFLTDLALISDLDKMEASEVGDWVALMTLHSAKGLEFPHVFLVGMEETIFPHYRSCEHESALEEERRLAYVGITRAEKCLHLSYARSRTLYGYTNNNLPSRFLSEIPAELMEERFEGKKTLPFRSPTPLFSQPTGRANLPNWQAGDKVTHTKWGTGTVIQVQGAGEELELHISFARPIGLKKLWAKFAPIQRV
jgi:DNA helicase II / ATP-dependent DNA helicase PcrA